MVTVQDLSLQEIALAPALQSLREAYFRAIPEVCVERPSLITQFSAEAGLFERERITSLEKARLYRRVLEHRTPVVWHRQGHMRTASGQQEFFFNDNSPFAGSTTSRFKGVPRYPEFMGLSLWPELWTMSRRQSNPYYISDEEIHILNIDVFLHWMNHNITELARARGTGSTRCAVSLPQPTRPEAYRSPSLTEN